MAALRILADLGGPPAKPRHSALQQVHVEHSVPATEQPPAPLTGRAWQVPLVLVPVLTQFCWQQSEFWVQMSFS